MELFVKFALMNNSSYKAFHDGATNGGTTYFCCGNVFSTNSYVEVRRRFEVQFPGRRPPTNMNIYRNVNKYRQHGTSLNRNSSNSGRPRSGRSIENIERV